MSTTLKRESRKAWGDIQRSVLNPLNIEGTIPKVSSFDYEEELSDGNKKTTGTEENDG
jgi:hypothetical protein